MNCSSARDSRASAPFRTTNRAPDSFAAASKSIRPSASPISKCSFGVKPSGKSGGAPWRRTSTLSFSSLPSGTSSNGRLGISAQRFLERRVRLALGRLEIGHGRLQARDLGLEVFGRLRVLARHRRADLLRCGVAPLLGALQVEDRGASALVERDQRFGARRQAAPRRAHASKAWGLSRMARISCMKSPEGKRPAQRPAAQHVESEARHYQNAARQAQPAARSRRRRWRPRPCRRPARAGRTARPSPPNSGRAAAPTARSRTACPHRR